MEKQEQPQFANLSPSKGQGLLSQKRFIIPLISVLTAILLMVIFWLPNNVNVDTAATESLASSTEEASKKILKQSPWQDAQLAKKRRAAQDILAKLLSNQESLESQGVLNWGEQSYQQALVLAKDGDEHYRLQNFEKAMDAYQRSLEKMDQLLAQVDDTYQLHMQRAQTALQDLQLEQAKDHAQIAHQLVTSLADDKDKAQKLLQRIAVADEVQDLIRKGKRFERQQDWSNAQNLYQQALQLDPENQTGSEAVARIESAITEQAYTQAMSQGYQALEQQKHQQAQSWFNKALQAKAGDSSARSALNEAKSGQQQAKINKTLSLAKAASAKEDWQTAVTRYQQVQKWAPGEVSAKVGLIEAQARLKLDLELSALLQDSSSLQDPRIQQRAHNRIEEATRISGDNERLSQQLAALKVALIKAKTPVTVTLRSDGQTQVKLLRHETLGLFAQRQLTLPPGRYTLVGQRTGYRDVRIDFKVSLSKDNPPVEVSCQELI